MWFTARENHQSSSCHFRSGHKRCFIIYLILRKDGNKDLKFCSLITLPSTQDRSHWMANQIEILIFKIMKCVIHTAIQCYLYRLSLKTYMFSNKNYFQHLRGGFNSQRMSPMKKKMVWFLNIYLFILE